MLFKKYKIFSNVFFSLSILVLWTNIVFGYPWPFLENGTNTIEQKIRQTIGAYRDQDRFHRGVDICPNNPLNKTVYPVVSGRVERIKGDQVLIGNKWYIHINPIFVKVGDYCIVGSTAIGRLRSFNKLNMTDHVHLQEADKSNPLLYLRPFTDNERPVVDGFTVWRDRTNQQITDDVIWGKIDFRVRGYDKMTHGVSDHQGKVMPYKLGYIILNENQNVLYDRFTNNPTIRFRYYPPNQNVRLIHYGIQSANPEYWVTNETLDGAIPENKYWNSKQKVNSDYNIDARINTEAQTPDGRCIIRVMLADISGNVNVINSNCQVTKIIDNFRPYVSTLTVTQANLIKYQAYWELIGNQLIFTNPINQSIKAGEILITIEFSEAMANVTASLEDREAFYKKLL
jgi:hypothetical protein